MLQIKPWQAKHDSQLDCGHQVKRGKHACALTLLVCAEERPCLARAIQACVQARQATTQAAKPEFLYWLWHRWFGKGRRAKPLP
jgi:hypothetical protein